MIKGSQKIFIALPAQDEIDNMESFIQCVRDQSFQNIVLAVCVNQPDDWWKWPEKAHVCSGNVKTLDFLNSIHDILIQVIDRCSPGSGWKGKDFGVGWARKTVMDHVCKQAADTDIMLSLDADTQFNPGYFQSIADTFNHNPESVALSVPYYHKLTGDSEKDRAILRYEIYMRYYAINLWRISSYYSFTAVGSAMALPVWAYRAIGGITPHKSGEDFYFIQKLRKYGKVLTWNSEKVYPAARYSDRVFFGTGPAMIRGRGGDWKSYPVYPFEYFDEVKQTTDRFPELFIHDVPTPMDPFLTEKFGEQNIWQPLRENCRTEQMFVKACHHKIDALRILQFLKWRNAENKATDETNLKTWFHQFYPAEIAKLEFDLTKFSLSGNPVNDLDSLRNLLCTIEEKFQVTNDHDRKP